MLIVANWKMNCLKAEASALVKDIVSAASSNSIVICPPFTLLPLVADLIRGSKVQLGAQDCHMQEKGAYTGDISAAMLKDAGANYVIVGHSERRKYHNESNGEVKAKAAAAISKGLVPIICIGESLEERQKGETENIIRRQLAESIPDTGDDRYVIAYEPIWAIGTGITAKADEIKAVHELIASKSRASILYGGSANDQNCREICAIANVSGLLVGGASLEIAKFAKIMAV